MLKEQSNRGSRTASCERERCPGLRGGRATCALASKLASSPENILPSELSTTFEHMRIPTTTKLVPAEKVNEVCVDAGTRSGASHQLPSRRSSR
jgi:hypothetical protein